MRHWGFLRAFYAQRYARRKQRKQSKSVQSASEANATVDQGVIEDGEETRNGQVQSQVAPSADVRNAEHPTDVVNAIPGPSSTQPPNPATQPASSALQTFQSSASSTALIHHINEANPPAAPPPRIPPTIPTPAQRQRTLLKTLLTDYIYAPTHLLNKPAILNLCESDWSTNAPYYRSTIPRARYDAYNTAFTAWLRIQRLLLEWNKPAQNNTPVVRSALLGRLRGLYVQWCAMRCGDDREGGLEAWRVVARVVVLMMGLSGEEEVWEENIEVLERRVQIVVWSCGGV